MKLSPTVSSCKASIVTLALDICLFSVTLKWSSLLICFTSSIKHHNHYQMDQQQCDKREASFGSEWTMTSLSQISLNHTATGYGAVCVCSSMTAHATRHMVALLAATLRPNIYFIKDLKIIIKVSCNEFSSYIIRYLLDQCY